MEIWRKVENEEDYMVSNLGNVKSLLHNIILKPRKMGEYNGVWCHSKSYYIHKLVARAFPEICGEWFEGCQVDHIDTNKLNNVATNLRVVSEKENHNNPLTRKHISEAKMGGTPWNKGVPHSQETKDKIRIIHTGRHLYDENPNSKEIEQYTVDGEYIQSFTTLKKAAETLGLNRSSLSKHLHGKHKTCGGYVWKFRK